MTAFASFCFVFVVVFFFFVSFFSFFFFFLSSSRRSPVNRLRISISIFFTLTFIASRNEGTNSFFFDDKDGDDDDDFVSAFFFFFALLLLPSVVLLPTGKLQTLRLRTNFEIKIYSVSICDDFCGRIKRSIDIYRSILSSDLLRKKIADKEDQRRSSSLHSLLFVRRFHFCCGIVLFNFEGEEKRYFKVHKSLLQDQKESKFLFCLSVFFKGDDFYELMRLSFPIITIITPSITQWAVETFYDEV